jgi:hypothetical protein
MKATSKRIAALGAVGLAVVSLLGVPGAATAQDGEIGVKAAFLYNFTKFVEWPASAFAAADAPITLCTIGDAALAGDVQKIVADRTAQNRAVKVRATTEADLAKCQVVYVPEAAAASAGPVIGAAKAAKALTVGETPDFLSQGGMVVFTKQDNRVRFEINEGAAKDAGLKISAKLLSLAKSGG